MFWRYKAQNFLSSFLLYDVPAIGAWLPLEVFTFQLNSAPEYKQWWIIINPDQQGEEDLIFFHDVSPTWVISYYRKDRDLLNNDMLNKRSRKNTVVKMKDVAERYNRLSKNVSDFWYIEPWYIWADWTSVKLFWWIITYADQRDIVSDAILDLPISSTREIIYDYTSKTFWFIETWDLPTLRDIHLWTVVTDASWIVSVVDVRPIHYQTNFSSTFFDFALWELVIKNGSIWFNQLAPWSVGTSTLANDSVTTAKILDGSVTSPKLAPNLSFSWYIELWEIPSPVAWATGKVRIFVKDSWGFQKIFYIDDAWVERELLTSSTPLWEVNTASNVWWWAELFLAKSWVDLQFKTLIAWPNVVLTEWIDTVTIESTWWWGWWPLTSYWYKDTFTWDWSTTVAPLSNLPISSEVIRVVNDDGIEYFDWVDWTLVWQTIVFTYTIPLWEVVRIFYHSSNILPPVVVPSLFNVQIVREFYVWDGVATQFNLTLWIPLWVDYIEVINDDWIHFINPWYRGLSIPTQIEFDFPVWNWEEFYVRYHIQSPLPSWLMTCCSTRAAAYSSVLLFS